MEFFCYHRDRPGSVALREELLEEHWSFMDRYAAQMIARGPTLASDGDTPTGSVHIVDLPDSAAARAFALDEPGYQAGVYRDLLLRRWRNTLGRTMWDFPGGRTGGNLYLVLGLRPGQAADTAVPPVVAKSEARSMILDRRLPSAVTSGPRSSELAEGSSYEWGCQLIYSPEHGVTEQTSWPFLSSPVAAPGAMARAGGRLRSGGRCSRRV
jgi:uncharacterized protein YciI